MSATRPQVSMQQRPLTVASLLTHGERQHGDAEIVSRRVEGDIHRTTWAGIAARARQIARWLDRAGLGAGERVATIAWNGYRHLELYYGVSASGRVLHTLNPRLAPAQLAWIINDADDPIVCFDATFRPLVQAVRAQCPGVRQWVELGAPSDQPDGYEALLAAQSSGFRQARFNGTFLFHPPYGRSFDALLALLHRIV